MTETDEMKQKVKKDIESNPVILFMKGSKLMPQCGYSAKVVHILKELGVAFETRNVLQDDALRQAIKEVSDWPTLPQLYVNQEFIGGCDIIMELYQEGELAKIVKPYTSICSSDT